MQAFCRIVTWAFLGLYVLALLLFLVGTFGWFGSPQGPLAGVFLAPLGLPWNLLLDPVPEAIRPWLAATAPLLNFTILKALCARFHGSV